MANSNKVRGVDLFNLTAPVTTAAIKVGFIDTATGYEYDYTICEANAYAQKNPGTVFIFKDGDNNIRYLDINEVNKLTPNDTLSTDSTCGGFQQIKPCGQPKVQFFGGGGIGAAGNPIIGVDGAVLAVDVIRGGHGYQYPPLVDLNDPCNNTNGAVLVAVLGDAVESYETYDQEVDFEDYEICPDTTVGFGKNWGPNGEDLGPWQPEAYTGISADPIAYEIDKYQKSLSTASNPFWTTRKKKPLKITYGSTLYNQTYLVSHPKWNSFTNTYAISPVPPSNVPGTDNSGKLFVFEWEVDFPYDGEYIIRGLCDNAAKVFIDNQFIADLNQFLDVPTPIKKTYKAGKHKIYINLLNVPIYAPIVKTPPVVKYAETVDMKRFFTFDFSGPAQSQHFYTSNPPKEFIAENNLNEEGLAFKLFKDTKQVPGTVDVYRLFKGSIGDHFYTTSILERNNAVAQGYNFEGVVGAAYQDPPSDPLNPDRVEVIRYFRLGTGEHFLTLDSNEMPTLSALGFQREGTAFYAPITIPILGGGTLLESGIDVGTIISSKSWNENPMGVSLTIDAPPAPVPQEKPKVQSGRCPPNPIWSTRFPKSSKSWYPVRYTPPNSPWSKFMNRYALSPVPPLDTPASDSAGITHINDWEVEIQYDGYYAVKATVDNTGRILIDGKEVHNAQGFNVEDPSPSKIFLKKGKHTITTEVTNSPVNKKSIIEEKIFSTLDWQSSIPIISKPVETVDMKRFFTFDFGGPAQSQHFYTSNPSTEFIAENNLYEEVLAFKLFKDTNQVPGTVPVYRLFYGPTGDHLYVASIVERDNAVAAGYNFEGIVGAAYDTPGVDRAEVVRYFRPGTGEHFLTLDTNEMQFLSPLGFQREVTAFYAPTVIPTSPQQTNSNFITQKDKITYEGLPLVHWNDKRWSDYMNKHSVSPYLGDVNSPNAAITGTFTLKWRNVTFPESGSYDVKMQGDNIASFTINGVDIRTTTDFVGDPIQTTAYVDNGTYDLVITLTNTKVASDIFAVNPSGVALEITKQTSVTEADAFSWQTNPVAISAVLISPPCPKKITGKGVVVRVNPINTGNTPSIKDCKDPNATYNLVTQKCECNPGYTLNSTTGKCEQTTPKPPPPGQNPICSTSTKGYTGPGIYLDLTQKTGKLSTKIKITQTSSLSIDIPDVENINASKTYDLDGGRIYGPISSKSGTVYVGSELIPPLTKLSDNDLVILDTDGNIVMTLNASAPIGSFVRCGSLTPFPTPTPTPTPPPPTPTPGPQVSGYPVCLILESIIINDPGINYECGVDKLSIVPDNGVVLDYVCDPFGKIKEVKIVSEGTCFSVYPRITLPSKTGINASFTPVFKVIRDPLDPALTGERQKLLQVTDLVGLKQTGYVDGRAYYGSVFYDQGAKYAGYYKTIGEPIRVYDTLQESITAQVTTPPSAIQRVGTDVTGNDPKLNIPGTPQ